MTARRTTLATLSIAWLAVPGVVWAQAEQAVPAGPWHTVDTARAMAMLAELPVTRAGHRTPEDTAGLQRTEALVLEKLRALGYEPQTQEVPRPQRIARLTPEEAPTPRNIWVDLPGEGELASEWLVVMAHADAVVGSPGADDNGTGVVALLEMARMLKDRPRQRSVRLLFTTLEEAGLHGARKHASETIGPRVESGAMAVFGAISLEMLGYYSDEPGSQRSPLPPMDGLEQPDRGDFLAILGVKRHQDFSRALMQAMLEAEPQAKVLPIDMFVVPPPDLMRSDHAEFLIRGWPGVMLTDTANFRNPHYHQASDTVDTIDKERFARAISQVIGAVDRLANPPAEHKEDAATP
ncbi:MAG: M20/M25/M40 family metallo-hydrolase [Phycisphaerales bacterium JB060]